MSSPRALFRLLGRPMAVVYLFIPLMATAWPVLRLEEAAGGPFFALWNGGAEPLVQSVRWQLAVLVPAALGLYSVLVRIEVLGSGMAWLLPGIRRGWLVGELVLTLPSVVALGWLAASGTTVAIGAAAAGVGLLAFNLPHVALLSGMRPWTGWVALGGLVAAAGFPMQLGAVAVTAPLLIAVVAGGAALWVFRVRFSDSVAREMGSSGVDRDRNRILKRFGARGEWVHSLATEQPRPWLLAIFYEAAFGSWSRLITMRLALAGFFAVMTYAFLDRYMLVFWTGMVAGDMTVSPLRTGLLYPVSRRHRAQFLLQASLLDTVLTWALLMGGTLLLETLPLPFEPSRLGDRVTPGFGLMTAVVLALLPIAVVWAVRSSANPQRGRSVGKVTSIESWLLLLAYLVLATLLIRPLHAAWLDGAQVLVLGGLGLSAAALYTGLWYATLRHYRRCDLGGVST